MGGHPPLGYDVQERKLVVNQAEAETVRLIFERYRALRSVHALKHDLDARGIVSKARVGADGSGYGGKPMERGALYALLGNRIYRGEITHKGAIYKGEHKAIVTDELFDAVQAILASNRVDRRIGATAAEPSLLAGLVFDADGERLTPTHAVKKGVRYRYYVSSPLVTGTAKASRTGRDNGAARTSEPDGPRPGQRLPAASLEALIEQRIGAFLGNPAQLLEADSGSDDVPDVVSQQRLLKGAARLAARWSGDAVAAQRQLLLAIVRRIDVLADRVEIRLDGKALVAACRGAIERDGEVRSANPAEPDTTTRTAHPATDAILLVVPAALKRAGMEMRLVVPGADAGRDPHPALLRLLGRAHRLQRHMMEDASLTMDELSRREGFTNSYATRLLRLAFLAPDVIQGILDGGQPVELTAAKLMADTRLPIDWPGQRAVLGFPAVAG
jgi:hypothetical protein